jgi:molybdopterin-guanine dinucleotide biosynthesis protein A
LIKSAVVIAGGSSKRLSQDKALLKLAAKPLIKHVTDVAERIVDDIVVAVSSQEQADTYRKLFGSEATITVDETSVHTPLAGVVSGFRRARGEYVLLLPCDTPFLSMPILSLLFELSAGKSAVIPRWPDCKTEPLQAVYSREPALEVAAKTLTDGDLNMQCMIGRLRGVRYISTLVLQQLDPALKTFFNINTPLDLRKAESMLRKRSR